MKRDCFSVLDLLNADQALFFGISQDCKPISYSAFGFDIVENIDPLIVEKYYLEFHKMDPFFNYLLNHSTGVTHRLISPLEIMTDEEFRKEKFYRNFIKPYFDNVGTLDHMLLLMLCNDECPIGLYFFFRIRGKPPFSDKQKQILELLISPLIENVRRIAIEEKVHERELIITELSKARSSSQNDGSTQILPEQYGLTEREAEVTELVATGMTNILIADKLGVSIRTVENHLRSIYKKLNIHNRTTLTSMIKS